MSKKSQIKKFKEFQQQENEEVFFAASGYIGKMMGRGSNRQINGILLATNRRIVFYKKSIIGEAVEGIPLEKISSVERRSVLGSVRTTFHTSNDDLTFKSHDSKDMQSISDYVENKQQEQPGSAVGIVDSAIEKIKKLAELKEVGVLTEEEFESKKAQLLLEV